ncbi:YkgJ family cysteine cluster protein [Desulfococcus sp.]|uniref:YkgJ family cysteine cluster protein n=1 Tax=Desulfococcus sp. TaxID=2025834 RepID=UPI003592E9C5
MEFKNDIPTEENTRRLDENGTFRFACHSGVACFTRCCHDADMYLYPYDIIRLKRRLGMTSAEFLAAHTLTAFRENPQFPSVMLQMSDRPGKPCSFLSEDGCAVYEDRPYSCRAYPLEPAICGSGDGRFAISARIVRHGHCLGHGEDREWSVRGWMEDQGMGGYNEINARWARVSSLFQRNPFGEKPLESPALKMVYMAGYNVDSFRRFVFESSFLSRFDVPEARLYEVRDGDTALLILGFDWILRFLGGEGPLRERRL